MVCNYLIWGYLAETELGTLDEEHSVRPRRINQAIAKPRKIYRNYTQNFCQTHPNLYTPIWPKVIHFNAILVSIRRLFLLFRDKSLGNQTMISLALYYMYIYTFNLYNLPFFLGPFIYFPLIILAEYSIPSNCNQIESRRINYTRNGKSARRKSHITY